MSVFVVGLNGCRLMPTSERKARLLLKQGKAFVEQKVPFTIRLNYKTGSTTQLGILGLIPDHNISGCPLCVRMGQSYIRKRSVSGTP